MTYTTYFAIRQILMVLLLYMGGHMLFVGISDQLKNSFYHRSIRVMGFAFLVVPISCLAYTQTNRLDVDPFYAIAISLTAYYATFTLMSTAFFLLLGRHFSRLLMAITVAVILLYPVPLWLAIYFGDAHIVETVVSASYSFFVIGVILLVGCILYKLRIVLANIDNYYSDDTMICVKWVSKSVGMLIGLAVMCVIAPAFFVIPLWLRLACMVYGVLCYFHIHYGYRRMSMNLSYYFVLHKQGAKKFVEIERGVLAEAIPNYDVNVYIAAHIDNWVEAKGYLQRGITINDVAKDIATNRTYLSKYINATYNCSFRNWVTSLRIEEAKRLMIDDVESSIRDIVECVGFASAESFTHIFTRTVGESPSKWRDKANC